MTELIEMLKAWEIMCTMDPSELSDDMQEAKKNLEAKIKTATATPKE